MVRHRKFQSVIGPLTLDAAFFSIFTFNFKFNQALISCSGPIVRQRNFQGVIASLNGGFKPLKQDFIINFFNFRFI